MEKSKNKKKISGIVISNKMDRTVIVEAESFVNHPVYNKVVKKRAKFFAHDEKNVCKIGDFVKIEECRPLSRNKRWRVVA